MAENNIGGIQFKVVNGSIDTSGTQVEVVERLGLDGTAFWDTGSRASESILNSWVDIANGSGVDTFEANCKALQGTSVTVYDRFGNGYSNVMVLEVRMTQVRAVGAVVGGENPTPEAIAWFQWRVKQSQ